MPPVESMKKYANDHELRAVIFALDIGRNADFALNGSAFMMPLVDKPVIQQAIESVVRCGVGHVDVIVANDVNAVQAIVNEGLRWGIRVNVHLAADVQRPYSILSRLASPCNTATGRVLVIHADTFSPVLPIEYIAGTPEPVAFVHNGEWTGSAILMQSELASNCRLNAGRKSLGDAIMALCVAAGHIIPVAEPLSLRSGSEFLRSQNRIMNNEFPELLQHVRIAEQGIWIGRNTRLHPRAVLTAPVFVGANCDIGSGVILGPNTVVQSGCLVNEKVTAANTLVLSSSSVGEGLDLTDTIVCGRRVFNTRINAAIDICDDVLIGDLRGASLRTIIGSLVSRTIAAALLLLMLMPTALVLGVAAMLVTPLKRKCHTFVKTPTQSNRFVWRYGQLAFWQPETPATAPQMAIWADLFLRVIPGLWSVMKGQLQIFGVTARTAADLEPLPAYWRDLLISSRSGLISESLVQFGPYAPTDPSCVADLSHTASRKFFAQQHLLFRYARSLLFGPKDFLPPASSASAAGCDSINVNVGGTVVSRSTGTRNPLQALGGQ